MLVLGLALVDGIVAVAANALSHVVDGQLGAVDHVLLARLRLLRHFYNYLIDLTAWVHVMLRPIVIRTDSVLVEGYHGLRLAARPAVEGDGFALARVRVRWRTIGPVWSG